jgi:deoxyadenosine/deoxycytidine kinase/signal transduction histidine kinase
MMTRSFFLAIEGPIGVGKTTLARLLQSRFQAGLLLEAFDENPFLADFYADRTRYAFQTQMFFLLSRYRQQQTVPESLVHGSLIADYTFGKDSLFAHLNLEGDELDVYDQLYEVLADRVLLPDLVIYLRAEIDELMMRIATRDRSYEREMDRAYIESVRQAYERFFADYTQTPLLTLDTDDLNYVRDPLVLAFVEGRVRTALEIGVHQQPLPQMKPVDSSKPATPNESVCTESEAGEAAARTAAARTAAAIEDARLYEQAQRRVAELEKRVAECTVELAAVNQELKALAYAVSHDLRAPLRRVEGFSRLLLEGYEECLDGTGRDYVQHVRTGSQHMKQLIDDLLKLSRLMRREMRRERVSLSVLAQEIAAQLQAAQPERQVEFAIEPGLVAEGDAYLLRVALEHLLDNAWKFTSQRACARIEFGYTRVGGRLAYFVRDDGVGFDMAYADKLFDAFQRLHAADEFEGTGIGLPIVQRIVRRHGGRVWAEGEMGQGATFYFTCPKDR